MRLIPAICLASALILPACSGQSDFPEEPLAEARQRQGANVTRELRQAGEAEVPPASVLQLVHYPSAVGDISGYLSPPPADGSRWPAIIWISGGDLSIGDVFWQSQPADNDQSASVFRDAGIATFYPSLRGLNGNPGQNEGFYGEVDDVIAATRWLRQQPGIDPDRIYLGGHSSGATLVLLAAEMADEWQGVFAFGPVTDPRLYGENVPVPIAEDDSQGALLRQPLAWLKDIRSPTFVIEGTGQGNIDELQTMAAASSNPHLHFVEAPDCDHFSVLQPVSRLVAQAISANQTASLAQSGALAHRCQ
ncbi:alpha/beta fold hydrolase [Altererythrobacter xixiisoli]|uniref:Alpha/beta fold hydrolase n=1 Tax=Croceibacterium xixiisoli TaxID=1476466 RepID=A0A6I4TQS1_9SPHN|nr:prolyl oligopeptidase family serine peptidase [Croceibacterium xixiisoli]MXO97709.1 alpha/beta fold hydrolase [Croceibacterium xixiisoli]